MLGVCDNVGEKTCHRPKVMAASGVRKLERSYFRVEEIGRLFLFPKTINIAANLLVMKKVLNPYIGQDGYGCVGGDPNQPFGLKLSFTFEEVEKISYANWTPHKNFQGYTDVVHGGVQATLLDEIGGWAVNTILGTGGVTSQLQIRYKKPARFSDGPFELKAWLISAEKRLANIQTQLFNANGELCAEAKVQYFIFPPEVAKSKLNFPDADKFFEQ